MVSGHDIRKIPKDTQTKILKSYLGKFSTPIPDKEIELFREHFKKRSPVFVVGKPEFLKRVGCYFLLEFGQVRWKFHYTYELVDVFLGNDEEEKTFYDDSVPFLILWHMKNTMANRQLEPMVLHTVSQRVLNKKPTLVLSESALPKVSAYFRNWKVFKEGVSEAISTDI